MGLTVKIKLGFNRRNQAWIQALKSSLAETVALKLGGQICHQVLNPSRLCLEANLTTPQDRVVQSSCLEADGAKRHEQSSMEFFSYLARAQMFERWRVNQSSGTFASLQKS